MLSPNGILYNRFPIIRSDLRAEDSGYLFLVPFLFNILFSPSKITFSSISTIHHRMIKAELLSTLRNNSCLAVNNNSAFIILWLMAEIDEKDIFHKSVTLVS
jgi:hypothetical protein